VEVLVKRSCVSWSWRPDARERPSGVVRRACPVGEVWLVWRAANRLLYVSWAWGRGGEGGEGRRKKRKCTARASVYVCMYACAAKARAEGWVDSSLFWVLVDGAA